MDGVAMASNAFLRLAGLQQGEIRGSATQTGREGRIVVIALSHEVVSPREGSGQVTGARQHGKLIITKELDRATVPLRQMLVTNERSQHWELQFWRPSTRTVAAGVGGAESQYFTVRLTDAVVESIDLQLPNTKDPDLSKLETFERVAFMYAAIQWTWVDGDLNASDTSGGSIV